jgi:hypothetical protein
MSITITDPVLLDQLAASGEVEFKDQSGRTISKFVPEWPGKLPPGVKSPSTEEQLAELRKQRTGRPLADILGDLGEPRDDANP